MDRIWPLFEEPPARASTLSTLYATARYRVDRGRFPKWTKIATNAECDECFALQHETHGAYGHRFAARHQRSFGSGRPTLKLCNVHAEQWRDRDRDDTAAGLRTR